MKKWLIILGTLLMVGVVLYGYRQQSGNRLCASVEETRRQLRQQGFRTDLADFNFTLPADFSARASAIISAGQAVRYLRNASELALMQTDRKSVV